MNLGTNRLDGVISSYSVAFVSIHLACFAVIWTGMSLRAMVMGLALYVVLIFAVGAGYHRYFLSAHRNGPTFAHESGPSECAWVCAQEAGSADPRHTWR
jgi:fatty-acid desaturase